MGSGRGSGAVRPQRPRRSRTRLSTDTLAELLAAPDTDPTQYELRILEDEPTDVDRLAARTLDDDGWGLPLDDPFVWTA